VRIVNQSGWHTPTPGGHEATEAKFIEENGGGARVRLGRLGRRSGSEWRYPEAPGNTRSETFAIVRKAARIAIAFRSHAPD
jgi:hypothetical protein